MAPPRRRAAPGTEAALLEDLLLARDAVGIDRSGADRLSATLGLLFGGTVWDSAQVDEARSGLKSEVRRAVVAFRTLHAGDAANLAAADSAETILLQPASGNQSASSIRRQALADHSCFIEPDSLRKRERAVLELVARSLHAALVVQPSLEEPLPTKLSIFDVLGSYAELAGMSVEVAAKLFSQRAALHDDGVLVEAVADAIWAVAQFGVFPVYAIQRLRNLGIQDLADQALEYLLEGMIRAPFVTEPGDMDELATAIRLGEPPMQFYERLLATPVMRPVVERFVLWLASHDPKVCLVDSNDVMIGYCGPHYYASLCESFVESADDYATGALSREFADLLSSMGLRERRRG